MCTAAGRTIQNLTGDAIKYLKASVITTVIMVATFFAITVYYFVTTPPTAIVVSADDFPTGLSTNFTANELINHVVAHIERILSVAESGEVTEIARQEGLGPRSVQQTVVPLSALSNAPSPVFDQKWKGANFNFFHALGTSLKTKQFLELEVFGFPPSGWRLTALLKERPQFLAKPSGSAPQTGGACSDFEKCADDLAEQVQRSLDYSRLLNFYIKTNTADTNRQILDLYENTIPQKSLGADDLVAWGNAFYGLKQYDQALQKYQEALGKNSNFCPARIARGLLYSSRAHGRDPSADLRRAEDDFREGIACDPKNEFAQTDLCHTLLREWTNSQNPKMQWLEEAKQHCDIALKINPQLVPAAVNYGYILYRQGQHAEALKFFDDLGQKYPTNSALFINYGFLLYLEYLSGNNDALKQATEETRQSWKLDEGYSAAANNLGYLYYEQGDYKQAVEYWKKANTLDPGNADYIAGFALGTMKTGDPKVAVDLLNQAIQLDAHYRDPAFLRQKDNWSERATSDLKEILKLSQVPSPDKQSQDSSR